MISFIQQLKEDKASDELFCPGNPYVRLYDTLVFIQKSALVTNDGYLALTLRAHDKLRVTEEMLPLTTSNRNEKVKSCFHSKKVTRI